MNRTLGFIIKVKGNDLFIFSLYHTYASLLGMFCLLFSIVAFIAAAVTWGTVDTSYSVLLLICGVLFTVWNPLLLLLKAYKQARGSAFEHPLGYAFSVDGMTVSRSEDKVEYTWESIRRVANAGLCVIIYIDRIHAHVLPVSQLDGKKEALMQMLKEYLPPSKRRGIK